MLVLRSILGEYTAIGPAFAALVALGAYRAHALDRGGAIAAFFVGLLTYLGALYGWMPGGLIFALAVLFAFFLPSVALSKVGRSRKRKLIDATQKRARDARQVLANGGIATLCAAAAGTIALLTTGTKGREWTSSLWLVGLMWPFAGAYAAATADTWATEIGSAFGGVPRSVVTFRPVSAGLSGGITAIGSLATLAGAAWIALVCAVMAGASGIFLIVLLAGVAGSAADSLLGATLQALYRCPACDCPTESLAHACGTQAVLVRGISWMTNDAVNVAATATGAIVAGGLYLLLEHH